jgi:hypothetical protein
MTRKMRLLITTVLLVFSSGLLAQTAKRNPTASDAEASPPVTEADVRIVKRATKILDSAAKWNRTDTRICPAEARSNSLYCALRRATEEEQGRFEHRGAVMQEARFLIDEIAPNAKSYHHRLMDFNNDPSTTFADIQKTLRLLEKRIIKRVREEAWHRP